ncbi:MAG: hypothetical protein AABY22_07840 [Nanoarchaeota archaeon]
MTQNKTIKRLERKLSDLISDREIYDAEIIKIQDELNKLYDEFYNG